MGRGGAGASCGCEGVGAVGIWGGELREGSGGGLCCCFSFRSSSWSTTFVSPAGHSAVCSSLLTMHVHEHGATQVHDSQHVDLRAHG